MDKNAFVSFHSVRVQPFDQKLKCFQGGRKKKQMVKVTFFHRMEEQCYLLRQTITNGDTMKFPLLLSLFLISCTGDNTNNSLTSLYTTYYTGLKEGDVKKMEKALPSKELISSIMDNCSRSSLVAQVERLRSKLARKEREDVEIISVEEARASKYSKGREKFDCTIKKEFFLVRAKIEAKITKNGKTKKLQNWREDILKIDGKYYMYR